MQFLSFSAARADTGAVLPRAKVTVYLAGTSTKAALFNLAGSSIGNPVSADDNGAVGFKAANGAYDLSIASEDGSYTVPPIPSVQLYDLTELDGKVATATAASGTATTAAGTATTKAAEALASAAAAAASVDRIANYDAYFTPFTDATIDINNKAIEGTDYKGKRYAQPAFGWSSEASSANYRVWIEQGAIKVLDRVKAKVTTLVTNVFIRNLRISPDEKSVFYQQFFALGGDWREMHVKINGTGSPAYAFSQKHIVCAGDSLTAGNGSTVGGLYGEQAEDRGIYGSAGYPRALWVDPAFQAAGIKIWNYGFSGAVSTAIADHYVNDLDADKKNWTVLACLGRNNLNPASLILDDFKRIEDAHSAYYERVYWVTPTTRRGAERVIGGVPSYQRGLLNAINDLLFSYVGIDRYIDVISHMIDGSASGALAQAIAAGATGRGGAVITRTAADDTDLAQQVSPDSLMADESGASDVHYNDAGFQYGWFPPIKAKLAAAGGYI